jgi:hypothetical protein
VALAVSDASATAGDTVYLTATLSDLAGGAVSAGVPVTLATDLGSLNGGTTTVTKTTDASGKAYASLMTTQTGTATVQAAADSVAGTATVIFSAGAPGSVTVTAVPDSLTVDETSTATATVVDQYGNPVPNETVTFSVISGLGTVAPTTGTTDAAGQATTTLSSEDVGSVTVQAVADSVADTATVIFSAGAPGSVTVTAVPDRVTVSGTSTVTAIVTDQYGNPVPDETVTFSVISGSGTVVPDTETTDAAGEATTTLSSDVAGTVTVQALADSVAGTAQVVFWVPYGTLQGQVTEEGRPTPPDARWEISLTVKLSQSGSVVRTETVRTDASGVFTITDIEPGTYDAWVKHSHTLAQCADGVQIAAGGLTTVDFGTLLEGDANDDNFIDIVDFSIWKSLFGTSDPTADFNNDGIVDIVDFSMWKVNFGQSGCPDPSG